MEHLYITIKELMGHKTLAMTERYSHLIPDVKRKAVESIEENFNSVSETKDDKNK